MGTAMSVHGFDVVPDGHGDASQTGNVAIFCVCGLVPTPRSKFCLPSLINKMTSLRPPCAAGNWLAAIKSPSPMLFDPFAVMELTLPVISGTGKAGVVGLAAAN